MIARLSLFVLFALPLAGVTVEQTNYHGWEAVSLRNKTAEAVLVPGIGRLMAFHFLHGGKAVEGPFWNNPALAGKPFGTDPREWTNFGGEKTWPAPQSDWPKTGAEWPPPSGFDATPARIELPGEKGLGVNQVALVFPPEKRFGIAVRRVFTLDHNRPLLTVDTTYQKVSGEPVPVAVWVITQLNSPERAFGLLNHNLEVDQQGEMPSVFERDLKIVSLARDPKKSTKVGFDGDSLLWLGKDAAGKALGLRIDTRLGALHPHAVWPDHGSHTEIYTNPDPLPYVELETLGPLQTLSLGDRVTQVNVYTLFRPKPDLKAESRQLLVR